MLLKPRLSSTFNEIQENLPSLPLSVVRDLFLIAASISVLFFVASHSGTKKRDEVEKGVKIASAGANIIRSGDYKAFNWAAYASPENPVFFDEGEGHIPPRPYIYLAQHPTLENAIKLQEWQRNKLEITNKVTTLLIQASKPMDIKSSQTNQDALKDTSFKVSASDFKNVSILYFYRSDCVHCQKTKPTIDKLLSLGVSVIPVQIDYKIHSPDYKNSVPYDSKLASVYPVAETPNFILKVGKETRSFKGEMTTIQLLKVISLIKEKKG